MNGSLVIGFVSAEFALGAVRIGLFSLCLGVCAALVPVPFLVSRRLRGLFDAIGPTGSWVGNYAFWMTVIGGVEIGVFAVTADLIAVQFADPMAVERLTTITSAVLGGGYVLVLLALALLLARFGIWNVEYDRRTVGLTTGVVLWYHTGTVLLSPYAFDVLIKLTRLV